MIENKFLCKEAVLFIWQQKMFSCGFMYNKPQNGKYLSELSPCKYLKFEN